MFNIASKETCKDGQTIFQEGSSGDWVFVVLSGQVGISKTMGGKKVVVQRLNPEGVFGELGFLGNYEDGHGPGYWGNSGRGG